MAEVIGPGVVLLAVAEGFGSVRGQAAPLVAALAVRDALRHRVRPDGRDARAALLSAFASANARVFAHSGSHDDYVASGSSISAALIVGDRAHIAHVGGTRAYLSRDGSLVAADDRRRTRRRRLDLGLDQRADRSAGGATCSRARSARRRRSTRRSPTCASCTATRWCSRPAAFTGRSPTTRSRTRCATTDSSESVTQRLLETGNLRGSANFGGTVIVGRALTDAAPPLDAGPGFNVRTAGSRSTALVIVSLIAASIFHVVLGP